MAARKYSASMDEHLLDEVQQTAEGEGLTVSAFLAQAAADRVALLGLQRLVDDYETEHGAFTDEELAHADALLDAAGVADNRARPLRPGS
ncbi:hypothetical protein [Iamia sp.]|uniref:hypothetical protein n=1 Tax=Iamia sp. TaxID=2722710 RepID=UPI002C79ED12|nr:hypothetical protein [Iamia sp.]HXH56401.1 hypothetical protein [Iamia sp.]